MPPADSNVRYLTCWYWHTRGSCIYSDDVCLYAHSITGRLADEPRARQPGAPAVAGANAARAQPVYHDWRRIRALSPSSASDSATSSQRQSLPTTPTRPNPLTSQNWRLEPRTTVLPPGNASVRDSQTPTPRPTTHSPLHRAEEGGQAPSIQAEQFASRQEYATGLQAITNFFNAMQINTLIINVDLFPYQRSIVSSFEDRARYYAAIRTFIDGPGDRSMFLNHVMARLRIPVRTPSHFPPYNPLTIPPAARAMFASRDRTERALRGVFAWAMLFLEDLGEYRRTRYAEADLFAAWGLPRVQAHEAVVRALLAQLEALEGEIRRFYGVG